MSIPPKLKVCGSIPQRGHNIFVEFEYLSCAKAASHGPKMSALSWADGGPSLLLAEAGSARHGLKALVAEGRRVRCAAAGLRVETSRWPPSPRAEDRKHWAIFAAGRRPRAHHAGPLVAAFAAGRRPGVLGHLRRGHMGRRWLVTIVE